MPGEPAGATVHVDIELTFDDVRRYQRRMALRSRNGRRTIVATVVLAAVIAFGALTLMGVPLLPRTAITVFTGAAAPVLLFVSGARQLRHHLESERGLLGRHDYEVTPAGLREWTDVNDTTTSWAIVREVERDGHAIYIWVGEVQGHLLPLRCFAGPSEADAFVAAVRLYAGAAAPA